MSAARVAVHLHEDLGLVQLQVDVGLHDAGVLRHLGQHLLRRARQVGVAVARLHDEFQRPRAETLPQAGRRDREGADARQRRSPWAAGRAPVSCVLRVRSVQSVVRNTAPALDTWPPPMNMKRRSNSGYCAPMASMASR
jgi:hypothetical protein